MRLPDLISIIGYGKRERPPAPALSSGLPLAASLAAGVLVAGQLRADATDDLCAEIASEAQASGGNVCVVINDGVATLSGYVQSEMERKAAERIALSRDGVDEVINLIATSD